MQIRLLGPMQVWHSGEPLALGGPKQRAVLAMLALNANRPVSQDALLGGLWGERASAGAVNAVQVYISRFRKEFDRVAPDGEDAELQRRGLGYVLLIKPDQIDLDRFEELADSGSRQVVSAPRSAAAALREALDLWRGRALAEFAGMPFAEPEIARLAQLHLVTVVARIDADLALGRHADLLAELELLAASHPLDERLHRRLILALYRAGRQADALHAYQRIRVRLTAELGRGPESTLRTLEQAVLAHDRRLDWRQVPDARPRMPAQPVPGRTPGTSRRAIRTSPAGHRFCRPSPNDSPAVSTPWSFRRCTAWAGSARPNWPSSSPTGTPTGTGWSGGSTPKSR